MKVETTKTISFTIEEIHSILNDHANMYYDSDMRKSSIQPILGYQSEESRSYDTLIGIKISYTK